MDNHVLFHEIQKNNLLFVVPVLLFINITTGYSIYSQVVNNISEKISVPDIIGISIGAVIAILVNLFLLYMKLETIITKENIMVRIFPLNWRFKFYGFDLIEKCYIRRYKPFWEFGGWGMRSYGNNRAYTLSGKTGIQIIHKNGSKTLIGTQKPDEFKLVIQKFGFLTNY